MSKGQMLRDLVMERLVVAADEIFALFERTIAEYEQEALRTQLSLETRNKGVQALSVNLEVVPSPEHIKKEQTLCVKQEEDPPLEDPLTSVQQEPPEESREEPGCSLYLQSDQYKQTYSCSDTDNSDDWEPPAKRLTTCEEQESKTVHRKDSKQGVQTHLVNKEPALLQQRPTLKNNTETSDKWTDVEVPALLSLYSKEAIQQYFDGPKRNIRVFGKIATELGNIGIHHTAKQCREKVKKLKQDYKKVKDYNSRSGTNRKSKWFDMLDSILSHRPAHLGSAGGVKDPAVGLLESLSTVNIRPLEERRLEPDGLKRPATGAPCLPFATSTPPSKSSLPCPSSPSRSPCPPSTGSSTSASTGGLTSFCTGSTSLSTGSTSASTGGATSASTGGFTSASTGGATSASTGGATSASTGGFTTASTGGATSAPTSSAPCLPVASNTACQPKAGKGKRAAADVLSSFESMLAEHSEQQREMDGRFMSMNEVYHQKLTQADATQAQLRAELAESRSMFVSVMDKLIAVIDKRPDTPH